MKLSLVSVFNAQLNVVTGIESYVSLANLGRDYVSGMAVVYFNQLLGARSTQKLVEINNNCPPILLHIVAYFNAFTRD